MAGGEGGERGGGLLAASAFNGPSTTLCPWNSLIKVPVLHVAQSNGN